MNSQFFFLLQSRFRLLAAPLVAVCGLALTSCANNSAPQQWTLWYIPNEPAVVVPLSRECHTFIFASAPDAKTFRVAIVKHVKSGPNDQNAYFHTGDRFTGEIELGPATIHDVSAGYDVNVDSVYRIASYVAAKARADADCPPPPKHVAPRTSPAPKSSPAANPAPSVH